MGEERDAPGPDSGAPVTPTGGALPAVYKEKSDQGSRLAMWGRFWLFGLAVAGFALTMNFFFRWVAFETPRREDLVAGILDGRLESRRMAAVDWLRRLHEAELRGNEKELGDLRPGLAELQALRPALLRLSACRDQDPSLLGTIPGIFGYGADADFALDSLRTFLAGLLEEDCVPARVAALTALTRVSQTDFRAQPDFLAAAAHFDPSVRKVGAFGLGLRFRSTVRTDGEAEAFQALERLLQDPVEDVRWNAALALAQLGEAPALRLVAELLSRAQNSGGALSEGDSLLYTETVRAAVRSHNGDLRRQVEDIASRHPNLKLRNEAKTALSL